MDSDFWHERWRNREIGFHQGEVNPWLQAFWHELGLHDGARVLVPLCGKSHDLLWLNRQGYEVLGVELSDIAVGEFFNDNALKALQQSRGRFTCWEYDNIQILCGNFFDLGRDELQGVAAVFDRAALIALPEPLRDRYCEHLFTVLPEAVPILLVTMEYAQQEMDGPPFSVSADEVQARYGSRYRIRCVATADLLAREARFRERGLSALTEKAWLLTPHGS